MFGLFKKKTTSKARKLDWVDYKGFQICGDPQAEQGQYRVGGIIQKGEGESLQTYSFLRADLIAGKDEAEQFSVMKAKLMIDQLGDKVFNS